MSTRPDRVLTFVTAPWRLHSVTADETVRTTALPTSFTTTLPESVEMSILPAAAIVMAPLLVATRHSWSQRPTRTAADEVRTSRDAACSISTRPDAVTTLSCPKLPQISTCPDAVPTLRSDNGGQLNTISPAPERRGSTVYDPSALRVNVAPVTRGSESGAATTRTFADRLAMLKRWRTRTGGGKLIDWQCRSAPAGCLRDRGPTATRCRSGR